MSESRFRAAALAIAVVFLLGVVALVAGPARGIRSDIDEMQRTLVVTRELITQQVELTEKQVAIGSRQLEVAEEQREIAERQLAIAEQTLTVASETRDIARETRDVARQTLELTRQLVGAVNGQGGNITQIVDTVLQLRNIAAQTLDQAKELNRKTPEGGKALP